MVEVTVDVDKILSRKIQDGGRVNISGAVEGSIEEIEGKEIRLAIIEVEGDEKE